MQRYRFENDDGRSPEIITAAKAYVEQFDSMRQQGKGLLLYGPPGTGKTFAAACIINALMDRGVSGLCTSLSRIVNQLPAYDGRQEFIDGINQFSVIVLDDFGVERDTDYMSEQVHTIIDARYRSRKPLIVTTNLTGQDMRQAQEMRQERVLSRLFEMCTPIEVTGKDRRKEKLRQKYKNDRVALGLGK